MADNTQTSATLAVLSMLAYPDTRAHTEITVSSWLSARVRIFIASLGGTANAGGVIFRVQGKSVGLVDHWDDIASFASSTTASAANLELTATEGATETEIAVSADPTSAFVFGERCYVRDTNGDSPASATGDLTGDELKGEFHVVDLSEAGPDIVTLVDGLGLEKDATDKIYPDVELFAFDIPDLGGYDQIRLLVEHRSATGSDIHYRAFLTAVTDFE